MKSLDQLVVAQKDLMKILDSATLDKPSAKKGEEKRFLRTWSQHYVMIQSLKKPLGLYCFLAHAGLEELVRDIKAKKCFQKLLNKNFILSNNLSSTLY